MSEDGERGNEEACVAAPRHRRHVLLPAAAVSPADRLLGNSSLLVTTRFPAQLIIMITVVVMIAIISSQMVTRSFKSHGSVPRVYVLYFDFKDMKGESCLNAHPDILSLFLLTLIKAFIHCCLFSFFS